MFEKIKQLSELSPFSGGTTEHVMFTLVLIVFLVLVAVVIILIAHYLIKGIQEMWSRLCDIRQNAIDAKVKIEQEYTKQIQVKGKTSKQLQT